MITSVEQMSALVSQEISRIQDPVVRLALEDLIVPPTPQEREWYFGGPGETILCWSVIKHLAHDTGIVYSDFGFGPAKPWGLVFLSRMTTGDESTWFESLERVFYETYAAGDLRIWSLIKKSKTGNLSLVETALTLDEAYEERNRLDIETCFVEPRSFHKW